MSKLNTSDFFTLIDNVFFMAENINLDGIKKYRGLFFEECVELNINDFKVIKSLFKQSGVTRIVIEKDSKVLELRYENTNKDILRNTFTSSEVDDILENLNKLLDGKLKDEYERLLEIPLEFIKIFVNYYLASNDLFCENFSSCNYVSALNVDGVGEINMMYNNFRNLCTFSSGKLMIAAFLNLKEYMFDKNIRICYDGKLINLWEVNNNSDILKHFVKSKNILLELLKEYDGIDEKKLKKKKIDNKNF